MLEEMKHFYSCYDITVLCCDWSIIREFLKWFWKDIPLEIFIHLICKFWLFEGELSWTQNENQENNT